MWIPLGTVGSSWAGVGGGRLLQSSGWAAKRDSSDPLEVERKSWIEDTFWNWNGQELMAMGYKGKQDTS